MCGWLASNCGKRFPTRAWMHLWVGRILPHTCFFPRACVSMRNWTINMLNISINLNIKVTKTNAPFPPTLAQSGFRLKLGVS